MAKYRGTDCKRKEDSLDVERRSFASQFYRAIGRDVITHRNQCEISLPHGKQDSRTILRHTRATVEVGSQYDAKQCVVLRRLRVDACRNVTRR